MAFDADRFLEAQAPVYEQVLAELRAGRKESHWMWFIFPQIRGLGRSFMAERYAICDLDEARAFLAHHVLGARLIECAHALLARGDRPIREIMGSPDDLKLRSSMTLFIAAQPDGSAARVFEGVLKSFYECIQDEHTLRLIAERDNPTDLI
jgi:uncharacterized protein (DUF1810 family)